VAAALTLNSVVPNGADAGYAVAVPERKTSTARSDRAGSNAVNRDHRHAAARSPA